MKRLTIQAIYSPEVRSKAKSFLYFDGALGPHDYVNIVAGWIRRHIIIVDEFEEFLQSPIVLLDEIKQTGRAYGDCDDVAMLGAALLAIIGALVRFRAIGEQPDGSFAHVFVEYSFPRDAVWFPFDVTIRGIPVYNGASITKNVIS